MSDLRAVIDLLHTLEKGQRHLNYLDETDRTDISSETYKQAESLRNTLAKVRQKLNQLPSDAVEILDYIRRRLADKNGVEEGIPDELMEQFGTPPKTFIESSDSHEKAWSKLVYHIARYERSKGRLASLPRSSSA